MKRTALTGLFLTAALLGSPVFAADDLCGANLQTLKDAQTSSGTNLSPENKKMIEETEKNAMAAKAKGDEKTCVELTTKTITSLKNIGSGSEGAGK
jgi:K+-transporting ATPase c subunit